MPPIRPIAILPVLCLAAACGPAAPSKPAAGPAEAPAVATVSALRDAPEFASCRWETVRGARLSIQAFACGPQFGRAHLEADDALPGFVLVSDGAEGPDRRPVVRAFAKAPAAAIDAVLPAVRAASPGPGTAACEFAPAPGVDAKLMHFVLTPVGDAKAAWDKSVESDTPQDLPCGAWGVGIVGDRYAFELPGHTDTVIVVDMGSEIQIFDPDTITVNAP